MRPRRRAVWAPGKRVHHPERAGMHGKVGPWHRRARRPQPAGGGPGTGAAPPAAGARACYSRPSGLCAQGAGRDRRHRAAVLALHRQPGRCGGGPRGHLRCAGWDWAFTYQMVLDPVCLGRYPRECGPHLRGLLAKLPPAGQGDRSCPAGLYRPEHLQRPRVRAGADGWPEEEQRPGAAP